MGESSSPFWIFFDLIALTPLVFAVRFVFPFARAMRWTLTFVGLYTYYLIGPRFVFFFVVYWIAICLLQFLVRSTEGRAAPLRVGAMVTSVLVALAPMIWWKLAPEQFALAANEWAARLLWASVPSASFVDALFGLLIPLGLSFTAFRATDLLIKVKIGLLEPIGFERTLYYGFFPPILALGPIAEYEEVQLEGPLRREPDPGDVAVGILRIAAGLVKIFLVATYLERIASWAWADGTAAWWWVWAAVLTYGLYFYANFSGYSDVAIGVARLWGVKLKENFNNPYLKTNPQAFWASWHMSLTRWAQRNIFVPLGGMRQNRQYAAIFMTIMVIALWHGLEWPLVIFGFYHATIVVAYRWLNERNRLRGVKVSASPFVPGLKMLAVFGYVSLSIPLFSLSTSEIAPFYALLLPFR